MHNGRGSALWDFWPLLHLLPPFLALSLVPFAAPPPRPSSPAGSPPVLLTQPEAPSILPALDCIHCRPPPSPMLPSICRWPQASFPPPSFPPSQCVVQSEFENELAGWRPS